MWPAACTRRSACWPPNGTGAVTGHLGLLAQSQLTGTGRPRIGNHLYGGFARDFRTQSGDSVMVVTLTARHFADLGRVTGLTETFAGLEKLLGADFADEGDRYEHREVIAALLAPWFARHTTDEVAAAFEGSTVLWERYRTFAELAADPRLTGNPLVQVVDQPGVGPVLATGSPLAQPGTGQVAPAPLLGADTAAVLSELRGTADPALTANHPAAGAASSAGHPDAGAPSAPGHPGAPSAAGHPDAGAASAAGPPDECDNQPPITGSMRHPSGRRTDNSKKDGGER
jgi:crotonobetainyl-CoA:carnitine CoA-transferase CaiB-like acyl-CoA transferase